MHICMYVCMCIGMFTYMHMYICVYLRICVDVYIGICMYICTYIYKRKTNQLLLGQCGDDRESMLFKIMYLDK